MRLRVLFACTSLFDEYYVYWKYLYCPYLQIDICSSQTVRELVSSGTVGQLLQLVLCFSFSSFIQAVHKTYVTVHSCACHPDYASCAFVLILLNDLVRVYLNVYYTHKYGYLTSVYIQTNYSYASMHVREYIYISSGYINV